jgi:hypothetical protein
MARTFGGGNLEVSEIAARPQVMREGRLVRALTIDNDRVADIIRDLRPPPRFNVPRVVDQSVPTGTLVQRGSTIDLTLVRPADIRFELFGEVHTALLDKNVAAVLTAMPANVTTIIGAKENPADLTQPERDAVVGFLNAQGVATAGGSGVNSFEAVYGVMQDIQVFR